MTSTLVHRGPDDEGSYEDEDCVLGHRRLSIIDLSPNGRQPIANEDGSVQVAFNGEIYNFQDLRRDLVKQGHRFKSRTDSEVLVHLYEERGPAMVQSLRGMFAFALWDARRRKLLLARDHFGQKPLFYAQAGQTLVFGSEIKAVLASELVPRQANAEALDLFLRIQMVPSPHTCFAGVQRLPPATTLIREADGRLHQSRYWSLAQRPKRRIGLRDAIAEADTLCRNAVREQLVADVPVGVFLSGGIDSSLIFGMSSDHGHQREAFTLGYENFALSEVDAARRITASEAHKHHVVTMRPEDAAKPERLIEIFDEPFPDVAALPLTHLARSARTRVKVALTGDGGDELFGGYQYHILGYWLHRFSVLRKARAEAARWSLRGIPATGGGRILRRARNVLAPLTQPSWHAAVASLRMPISEAMQEALYTPDFGQIAAAQQPERYLLGDATRGNGAPSLDALFCPSGDLYLADRLLMKTDMATMAAGLECRSPFLDLRLAEFAASLPLEHKIEWLRGKWVLRRLLAQTTSGDVWRRRKLGFTMPLDSWLKSEFRELMHDTVLSANARVGEYLKVEVLRRLYREHCDGTANWRHILWSALLLELWLQRL